MTEQQTTHTKSIEDLVEGKIRPFQDQYKLYVHPQGYFESDAWEEVKQAMRELVGEVLNDFSEYCHSKYNGCIKNEKSKTGYDYSYEQEVTCMADDYLTQLKGGEEHD